MDTRYQNYFLEIVKRKSFSKAASYLFVTQSSLSQYLAKEEEELGVKLLIRDRKELKMTYAGELYLQACREMIEIKDRLYRQLADLEQSRTGVTRLGITPQWGGLVLAEILPTFTRKYPFARLKVTEDTAHPLFEGLKENALDLALIAVNDGTPPPFHMVPVYKEELILAVPHKLLPQTVLKGDEIGLDSLLNAPFIISKERTVIRDITNEMFQSANMIPKVLYEINNHEASLRMVEDGLGITIIPRCYRKDSPKIMYFSISPGWYWNISVVIRRGYELNKADQYLINLLQKYYEEQALLS